MARTATSLRLLGWGASLDTRTAARLYPLFGEVGVCPLCQKRLRAMYAIPEARPNPEDVRDVKDSRRSGAGPDWNLFFSETGGIIGMRPTVHHRKAMPATPVFVPVETAAARKIQRFWFWCRLFATNRVLAKRFERLSLRAHDMQAMRCCFFAIIIIVLFCVWSEPLTRPCLVASSERLSTSDSRRWWIPLACSSSA